MIDWAVGARPLAGQSRSGDSHVVKPFAGGTLVGVVDGLGHGEEAGEAADAAVGVLEANAHEPLERLVRRCHEALRGTRGAVMSLASIREPQATMSWIGVGNVEAVLVRPQSEGPAARDYAVLRGGIVGYTLPQLVANVTHLNPTDVLILATDGIGPGFAETIRAGQPTRQIAERILADYARDGDDALVLVARVGEDSG